MRLKMLQEMVTVWFRTSLVSLGMPLPGTRYPMSAMLWGISQEMAGEALEATIGGAQGVAEQ